MNKETKALLINAAKDALLDIAVLIADKLAQSARTLKEAKDAPHYTGGVDWGTTDPMKKCVDPDSKK